MSTPRDRPVKYIAAVLYQTPALRDRAVEMLVGVLGTVDEKSETFAFTFSDFYSEEMGDGLTKQVLSFQSLRSPGELPDIKWRTNAIEQQLAVDGKRRVNIDPGYVTAAKLVLASGKDCSHRILIASGIFGDPHLAFHDGQFHPNPWTYADYREPHVLEFMRQTRDVFLRQQ